MINRVARESPAFCHAKIAAKKYADERRTNPQKDICDNGSQKNQFWAANALRDALAMPHGVAQVDLSFCFRSHRTPSSNLTIKYKVDNLFNPCVHRKTRGDTQGGLHENLTTKNNNNKPFYMRKSYLQ